MKGRDGSGGVYCRWKNRKQNTTEVPEDKLEMETVGPSDYFSFIVVSSFSACLAAPPLPPRASLVTIMIWFTLMHADYMIFQPWIPMANRHFCVCSQHRGCGSAQALDDRSGHPGIMLHCLSWGPWVSRE